MFDVLTYQKGAGVLRMLERYLGPERFRDGVRRYLEAHRFGNTETADLWDAIEEASGEPVRDIMDSWILQGGFPLVTVDDAPGPDTATWSGDPAPGAVPLRAAAGGPSAIGSTWKVPVIARAIGGGEARVLLGAEPEPVDLGGDGDQSTVVVNAGGSGFYRVRYAPEHHRPAGEPARRRSTFWSASTCSATAGRSWWRRRSGPERLPPPGRGARRRGRTPTSGPRSPGRCPCSTAPWTTTPGRWSAAYTRALLGPVLDPARMGGPTRRRAPHAHPAGPGRRRAGHGRTRPRGPSRGAPTPRRGPAWRRSRSTPTWRRPSSARSAASGGPEDFEVFLEHYRHPTTPQEEMRYLYALAGFADPTLAARAFELARDRGPLPERPVRHPAVAGQPRQRPGHLGARPATIGTSSMARIPANILPRMLGGVTSLCRDPQLAADAVTAFVRGASPGRSGQRTVDQTLERLEINVSFAASSPGDGRARAQRRPATPGEALTTT